MTAAADKNFFRITGDEAGNVWVNDVFTFPASLPGIRELQLGDIVPPPGGWADALKFSSVRRLRARVRLLDARACREDAIDVNNACEDVELHVEDLHPGGRFAGTIKGASRRIALTVTRQHGHGSETDYDLGNFSDQGNARTTGVSLDVQATDRRPVRVRLLSADRPALLIRPGGQPYEVDARAQGWFYPVFNFLKDLLRTFRIKL